MATMFSYGGSKMRSEVRDWSAAVQGQYDSDLAFLQRGKDIGMPFGERVRGFLSGGMRGEQGFDAARQFSARIAGGKGRASGKGRAALELARGAAQSVISARGQIGDPLQAMYGQGITYAKARADVYEAKARDILTAAGLMKEGYMQTAAAKEGYTKLLGTVVGGIFGGSAGAQAGGAIGQMVGGFFGRSDKRKAARKLKEAMRQAGMYYDSARNELRPVTEQGFEFGERMKAALSGKTDIHEKEFAKEMERSMLQMVPGGAKMGGKASILAQMRSEILAPLMKQFEVGTETAGSYGAMSARQSALTAGGMGQIQDIRKNLAKWKSDLVNTTSDAVAKGFGGMGGQGAPGMDGGYGTSVGTQFTLGGINRTPDFAGGLY